MALPTTTKKDRITHAAKDLLAQVSVRHTAPHAS